MHDDRGMSAFLTEWTTSLFPKDGRYIVPVKTSVRGAEGLEWGTA